MSETRPFDLLLRGGHVICRASGINGTMDVAVREGKIAAVEANILPSSAANDLRGRFLRLDNEKNDVVAERLLQPAFCLRAGSMFDAISPILHEAVAA